MANFFSGLANKFLHPNKTEFTQLSGQLEERIKEIESEPKNLEGLQSWKGLIGDYSTSFANQLFEFAKDKPEPIGYLDVLKVKYPDHNQSFNLNSYFSSMLRDFLTIEVAKKKGVKQEAVGIDLVNQAIDDGEFKSLTPEMIELFFLRCLKGLGDHGSGKVQGLNLSRKSKEEGYRALVATLYKVDRKPSTVRAHYWYLGISGNQKDLKDAINPKNIYAKLMYAPETNAR